ncbi:MAG: MarR family winged helix-turn-helix transcriptional regulator [bacterium]|jgi:DNA-binding MarR family transcriptional regulator
MAFKNDLSFTSKVDNPAYELAMNIRLTGTILSKEGDRILRPIGLTDSQFNVLMVLKYQTQDGVMNQTVLGNILQVNRSNITGLVDRMEQAGWVKRSADRKDRRVNHVRITRKGHTILSKAEKVYFEYFESIFGKIAKKDQQQAARFMERFREEIRPRQ